MRPLGNHYDYLDRHYALSDALDVRATRITNAVLQFGMTTDDGVLGLADGDNALHHTLSQYPVSQDEIGLG